MRQCRACLTELLGWFCWGHMLPGPPLRTPVTHLTQSSGQSPLLPRNRLGRTWLEGPLSCWEIFPPHSTPIMPFCLRISKDMFSPFLVTWGTESPDWKKSTPPPPAEGPPWPLFWLCQLPDLPLWLESSSAPPDSNPGQEPWFTGDCQCPSSSPHSSGLTSWWGWRKGCWQPESEMEKPTALKGLWGEGSPGRFW